MMPEVGGSGACWMVLHVLKADHKNDSRFRVQGNSKVPHNETLRWAGKYARHCGGLRVKR